MNSQLYCENGLQLNAFDLIILKIIDVLLNLSAESKNSYLELSQTHLIEKQKLLFNKIANNEQIRFQ